MNQLLRHRLPPSVRSLLTDIGPKDDSHCSEWTESEPEPETVRDGIVLPSRGTANSDEFLTPANAQTEDGASASDGNIVTSTRARLCGLCKSEPPCYTCPRCNVPYCSVVCYRSPEHTVCSEEFYKQSVLQELKDMGQTEAEGRKKMQDILLGLNKMADQTDGGMESVLRDVGIGSYDDDDKDEMKTKAQVLELLSRFAELQQAGEGGVEEVESILRKLKEIEASADDDAGDVTDDEAECGEEAEPGLADRLSGLDIDKLSEEALWDCLSSQEKERFVDFIKGGICGELVPPWRPWWEMHEDEGRALVELLDEEVGMLDVGESVPGGGVNSGETDEQKSVKWKIDQTSRPVKPHTGKQKNYNTVSKSVETALVERKLTTKMKTRQATEKEISRDMTSAVSSVPPISVKIPTLSSLSPNPSPLVCYGLVNALFGYTFTLTLFNGDAESLNGEFCDTILAVSEALSTSRVFHSIHEALQCGEDAVQAGAYFDTDDPHASTRAMEAVAHVMTGGNRWDAAGYCLSALSQLRSAFSRARASLPKGGEGGGGDGRRKYFLAGKKCEFFQAWVVDNAEQIRRLAIGLWREHSGRCSQRNTLEREKQLVESWKKGKRRGNDHLIEELN